MAYSNPKVDELLKRARAHQIRPSTTAGQPSTASLRKAYAERPATCSART